MVVQGGRLVSTLGNAGDEHRGAVIAGSPPTSFRLWSVRSVREIRGRC
jgi:hypothetical protein